MANTGQLGTTYSQLGGIILGTSEYYYMQFGIASVYIDNLLLSRYRAYSQAGTVTIGGRQQSYALAQTAILAAIVSHEFVRTIFTVTDTPIDVSYKFIRPIFSVDSSTVQVTNKFIRVITNRATFNHSQAGALIVKSTWWAQAFAWIDSTYGVSGVAQVETWILTSYQGYAQSNASILTSCKSDGQAQSLIKHTYPSEDINDPGPYGQAEVYIILSNINYQAQAEAWIIGVDRGYGQAQVYITPSFNQQVYGQSNAYTIYQQETGEYIWLQWAQAECIVLVREIQAYSQTQSQVYYPRLKAYAQAGFLYARGLGIAQAEVYISPSFNQLVWAQGLGIILVYDNQVYGQAHVIIGETQYSGQSQVYISPSFNQLAFSQALAIIQIPISTQLFLDTFGRVTTDSPFNLGISDSGHSYYLTSAVNGNTSNLIHTDGSNLIFTYNNTGYYYSTFYFSGPPTTQSNYADVSYKIWVNSNYENIQYLYWVERDWYFNIGENGNPAYIISGSGGSANYNTVTRNVFINVRVIYDPTGPGGIYLKGHIWREGDAEPGTWTTLQTQKVYRYNSIGSTYYNQSPILSWTRPYYEAGRIDNIRIISAYNTVYNQAMGYAGAQIFGANAQVYGQAGFLYAQGFGLAQAAHKAQTEAIKGYGQAAVLINIRRIWSQAQAMISIPDTYTSMIRADGATHFYGMHSYNTINDANLGGYWKDEIGVKDANAYYGTSYQTVIPSPAANERVGISMGLYPNYRRWYSITEFSGSAWSLEGWVRSPSTTSTRVYAYDIYSAASPYHYLTAYFGSGTSNAVGTKIAVAISNPTDGQSYYDTGITYAANTWYHIAITYSNKVFKVYIDGVLKNTITRNGWAPTPGAGYYFNLNYSYLLGSYSTSPYFPGYDNVTIYPIELTSSRILAHVNMKGQAYAQAGFLYARAFGLAQATYSLVSPWADTFQSAQAEASIVSVIRGYAQATASIKQTYPTPSLIRYQEAVLISTPDAYWPLDDSINTTARELVSNKVATLVGSGTAPTPTTYSGNSGIDPGWTWAGSARYLSSSYYQPSTTVAAVEFWIKTTGTGEIWQGRYGDSGSGGRGITVTLSNYTYGAADGTGRINFFVNSDFLWHGVSSNAYVNDGLLHHIVCVWRGGGTLSSSQFFIYIDGQPASTYNHGSTGSASGALTGNPSVGYFLGRSYVAYSGYISNLAFYTHDLTSEQVAEHYSRTTTAGTRPFGQAQVYVGHFQWANANARIKLEARQGYGQSHVQIGGFRHAQAIVQIIHEMAGYRKTVLNDRPILYYPLDEVSYGGAYYSASSVYNSSYLPEFAADGNTSDGWASSGYAYGQYWQVTWDTPQTFTWIRVVARPGNDYSGFGRILLSDETYIHITYPPAPNGVAEYNITANNITWMRLISDTGGVSNPGFSEVEAYNGNDGINLIRYPIGTGQETDRGILHTIVGRRHATWRSPGAEFLQDSAIGSGYSIDFDNHDALVPTWTGESLIPLTAGAAITVETWLKFDGANRRMILGFNSYDFITSDDGRVAFNDGSGNYYGITGKLVAGNWYHLVGVMYTGQAVNVANKIYINGVQQVLSAIEGSVFTKSFTQNFVIGGWNDNTSFMQTGQMDELSIFNYELTAQQVLNHYNSRTSLPSAQAQARIYSHGYPRYAQALAQIGHQAFGQAEAKLLSFDYPRYSQAQVLIQENYALVRMSWLTDGSTYNVGSIYEWGNTILGAEYLDSQPNYSSGGTNPTSWVRDNNWGMAWSGVFVADATGTWSFQIYNDDGADLWISGTRVVDGGFPGGHSPAIHSGTIDLIAGELYTIHARWAQGGGPWDIQIKYMRPLPDVDWHYLTDNNPPWIRSKRYEGWGQAAVVTLPPLHTYDKAQAQAWIKIIDRGYSQAEAWLIGHPRAYGLALAQIGHQQFGLALADIKQTYLIYSQALVFVGHFQFGSAKARILVYGGGDPPRNQVYAQAMFWYLPPTQTSQAQAKLNAFNVNRYAVAQAKLRAFGVKAFGQARVLLIRAVVGQSQSRIKQTYPLFHLNNYALSSLGATVTALPDELTVPDFSDPNLGAAINTIDGMSYTLWDSLVIEAPEEEADYTTLEIDLKSHKTITGYYILPNKYNVTVALQYRTNISWTTVETIYFPINIFTPLSNDNAISGFITPVAARWWRLRVLNGGDGDRISIATFGVGVGSIQSGTFAQAMAMFGHYMVAQAAYYISPAFDQNVYGQAQADIKQTYQIYGQSEAWLIPPTQWSQALAQIIQTYALDSNAMAWIIPPTQWSQALATIKAYDIEAYGFAKAHILGHYARFGNARTHVTKPLGHAHAAVRIFRANYNARGGAIAYIGHFHFAQAGAFIVLSMAYSNTQAQIKTDYIKFAQAMVSVQRFDKWGLACARILQDYRVYSQANVVLNQSWGIALTNSRIHRTYYRPANARTWVEATYQSMGQANIWVRMARTKSYSQAETFIVKTITRSAQAKVQIGGFQYAQASTRMLAFNVPKFGLSACYILANKDILPPTPTSGNATYLVQYSNQLLPGYAQSEAYDSLANIATHYASYMSSSLSEYIGLQNKTIDITMLVWEPTYLECKLKAQEAATILRGVRRQFAKLYIGSRERYYLAMPQRMVISKGVPTSSQTLTYDITFEAKPWIIDNTLNTISTGTLDTGSRTLADGGWTPTTIIVSGTDITISGITETGQDTGTIYIDGTVSNFVIDSDSFTSSDNSVITPKNYGIYVGPGKTAFTITGATDYTITWQNRYYL